MKALKTVKSTITVSCYKSLELLQSQKGRIMSVDVIRKDGVFRTMTGRMGVTKFLKPVAAGASRRASTSARVENANVTFYELGIGYRSINLGALVEVRAAGKVFLIK